jgi:Subtilase family
VRSFLRSLAVLVLCAVPAAAQPADGARREIRLRVATFDPRVQLPELPAKLRLPDEPRDGYFIVQLDGRADRSTAARLRAHGATPLAYVPDGAFVVRLAQGRAAGLRAMDGVRWLGAIEPAFKLAPDLGVRPFADGTRRAGGVLHATVDLFPGEDLGRASRLVAATGATVRNAVRFSDTARIAVRATLEQLEAVARIPAVSWIEEAGEITPRNNSATWVVQTNVVGSTTVWGHSLHGEGQIIGLIDFPMDMSSCFFRDPANNTPGPTHRKVVAYRSTTGLGADFHGTHTAGIAAGNSFPINSSLDSAGHAYAAKLSFTNVLDVVGSDGDPSNLYGFLSAAHADGARVHTNSWGDDGSTSYTTWSRDVDLFSHDFEDSLVLFAVTNLTSLHTPENAKNCLAVAATSNGASADTFCKGGAGPTSDGRRKPEILAPGCGVTSARELSACGVRTLNGTSMASPAVAGAATLARQYFVEGWYPTGAPQIANSRVPSGALLKAVLINSAVNLTTLIGFPGNTTEGWGRALLENALYFAGDARRLLVLADVRNTNGLETTEQDAFVMQVTSSAEPLEVTMAYTDVAAALLASDATVNDLDLEVISPSGLRYRGNAFDGVTEHSTTVGQPDPRNNVEGVVLPSPEIGTWLVSVHGTSVNDGPQGYALVATGNVQTASTTGILRYAGHGVDEAGSFGDGDGSPEPGETVTVPLSLLNLKPTTATSLQGQLYSGDLSLASVIGGSAPYVDLPSQEVGESLLPHFKVALSPLALCGQPIPMKVRATYSGGTNDSTFQFVVGDPFVPGDEDSCMPPDCPGDPLPADVGPTLTVARSGASDLLLQWAAVASASGYRVYCSGDSNLSTAVLVGSPAGASFVHVGARSSPAPCYYRVRAVNSCGWEGP